MKELQHCRDFREYNSVLGDAVCGAHLMLFMLEVVLVRRLPGSLN